jgi:hypothetical protein
MYCAFVGLDNKLYKMHSKYIKIYQKIPSTCFSLVANITKHRALLHRQLLCSWLNSKYITQVLHDDRHTMNTCNRDLEKVHNSENLCVLYWHSEDGSVAVCAESSKEPSVIYVQWMCVCRSHNFVWHLVSDLFLQPLLIVNLSLGQLFVFYTVM